MKLHPRYQKVQHAKNRISQFICEEWDTQRLTAVEVVGILAQLVSDFSVYPLRAERHPHEPEKKANEA